jgi:hypothetical protein
MDALDLLAAAILQALKQPARRPVLLRPRPAYLPHPCRRFSRQQGVIPVPPRKVWC